MDREFYEMEFGKVISEIEFFALQKNLKLMVIVDSEGEINKHYDFLRDIPFARSDN
jgi:hypothetical protein